ncbi:MAG TPA: hypothetical protein VKV20_15530 [Ktedonobacteraceae bacterium]|jgi:plastocyanin|nr:hypothetical protein [Ktedonobacteraceae bacterium]
MVQDRVIRVLRMCFLSSLLALVVLLVLPFSASALSVAHGQASTHPANSVTVKIVQKHGNYKFKPKKVTVTQGEQGTLDNTTNIDQTITYMGAPIYTIPANSSITVTIEFTPGTYVVSLQSNPNAHLTIIVK